MLTRPAQAVWSRRVELEPELKAYPRPDFEAIYIPSDVRWSYELSSISRDISDDQVLAERTQRAAVAVSCVSEITRTFEMMLFREDELLVRVARRLIEQFRIKEAIPTFGDIRLALLRIGETLRNAIVKRDIRALSNVLDAIPASFTGHAIDPLISACTLFLESVPSDLRPKRWALCFDELEIAPLWLKNELLNSFRSVDQPFLFKLTWSPVLPLDIMNQQHAQQDYATIPMWHSHANDARPFARELKTRIIRQRLNDRRITPRQLFGTSPFAQEERVGEANDVYAEGSEIWRSMVELARRDPSFRDFLVQQGLNPENPISDNIQKRDVCLRKIKPIVLVRETFRGAQKQRSRKRPTLYAGEEAIYSMSEGNPRLLYGIVNELLDASLAKQRYDRTKFVSQGLQARILAQVSRRTKAGIAAYPTQTKSPRLHLSFLLDKLGALLHQELVGAAFNSDPAGSFFVDQSIDSGLLSEIERGLLIGAFIAVGKSNTDVPTAVVGCRIRLSYMLSPTYKLLFRNYHQMALSRALKISDSMQPSIFSSMDGFE
jgi:hypothetical protein